MEYVIEQGMESQKDRLNELQNFLQYEGYSYRTAGTKTEGDKKVTRIQTMSYLPDELITKINNGEAQKTARNFDTPKDEKISHLTISLAQEYEEKREQALEDEKALALKTQTLKGSLEEKLSGEVKSIRVEDIDQPLGIIEKLSIEDFRGTYQQVTEAVSAYMNSQGYDVETLETHPITGRKEMKDQEVPIIYAYINLFSRDDRESSDVHITLTKGREHHLTPENDKTS